MKKIVLFGDSLFNGFRNHRNTTLVTDQLQQKLGPAYEIVNLSKSGATTVEGLDFLTEIPHNADLILLEYGTNDASLVGISPENYQYNLEEMIKYCQPKKTIIVGPWQDQTGNSYTIPANLRQNERIAKKLANKYHCPYIDLLQMRDNADLAQLYQSDGLHLTDYGNEQLTSLLTTAIKKELAN